MRFTALVRRKRTGRADRRRLKGRQTRQQRLLPSGLLLTQLLVLLPLRQKLLLPRLQTLVQLFELMTELSDVLHAGLGTLAVRLAQT